ncbi:riboflavin synthase [Brevibacterium metallidurans]|uniref:Riboflavin synthase n=1 Tax=Brevibacterium metallidurans TaxID=1482676 RepID=A0ABN0SJC5_9MICO
MFTGIIEGIGRVVDLEAREDSAVLTLDAGDIVADLEQGGSLAVNGVCLTSILAEAAGDAAGYAAGADDPAGDPPASGRFVAEIMGETLRLTGIGALTAGDEVNLERCTPASGRFDGHVVQGHVDGLGSVIARTDHPEWTTLRIGIPADLAPFTAVKGSIALNGVSLTVTAVSDPPEREGHTAADAEAWVEVGLIPATLAHTTFGRSRLGDPVNVEVDVIAKYTARLLAFAPPDGAATTAPTATPSTTDNRGVDHD